MLDGHELMVRQQDRYGALPAPYMPPQRQFALPPEPEEQSILSAIVRHIWITVACLFICLAFGVVYLKMATKLYTSTCRLYLEQSSGVKIINDQLDATPGSDSYLATQADELTSTPLFKILLQEPQISQISVIDKEHPLLWLRQYVTAEVDRRTSEILLSVVSVNPEDSANLVNLLVDTYIDNVGQKAGVNKAAVLAELIPERDKLQKEYDQDDADSKTWRLIHPASSVETNNATVPENAKLATAIQNLASVRMQLLQMQQTWGAGHPQVQKLEQLQEQLEKDYQDALHEVEKANAATKEYIDLQADMAKISPQLLVYSQRIDELKMATQLAKQLNNVTIVEPGAIPLHPSSPKPLQTLALAGVLGLLLGGTFSLMRDRMDGRIRSADEIQAMVGLPILGVIPHMSGRRTAVARAMAVHLDPRSIVAEAYRTIRTAIYFGAGSLRARTLLVTSPEPGDGKTTNASNLAIAIAQTGRSVLLLDADFRKPTQHKNLDVKDAVGLSSVLAGIAPLDQAVQHTGVEGLDILPCGSIPENPSEILNSQEFGDLVDRLALKYDHIIFDSPPVNLVTDARILGAVCDGTILVLRSGTSTRKGAEHARNALMSVGTNILGVIVNDASRGKGYQTYGGAFYGTPSASNSRAPTPSASEGFTDTMSQITPAAANDAVNGAGSSTQADFGGPETSRQPGVPAGPGTNGSSSPRPRRVVGRPAVEGQ